MPAIGFGEPKAEVIMAGLSHQTIRESKCRNVCNGLSLKDFVAKYRRPKCYSICSKYNPRIKIGDIVKLYLGMRQRKYCKVKGIFGEGYKCSDLIDGSIHNRKCLSTVPKDCEFAGAYHFKTWKITDIITKPYRDYTEEDARADGFIHRPGMIRWNCHNCLVKKWCGKDYKDPTCTSLFQLRLFLRMGYNAQPDSLFDMIIGDEI